MTPRQITAYTIVASRRLRTERAADLNIMASAFRSDEKQLENITARLMRER